MTSAPDRLVDHSALRTNQAFIITLLILAFVLNAPALVLLVCAIMLSGTFISQAALFKRVYFSLLKPRGIVRPDVQTDNPEPHQFAQLVGGAVLAIAIIALFAGASALGWGLVWLVVALASLNLFARICVGCLLYYQLHRMGIRGFAYAPIRRELP
jgi:hypothetical protein